SPPPRFARAANGNHHRCAPRPKPGNAVSIYPVQALARSVHTSLESRCCRGSVVHPGRWLPSFPLPDGTYFRGCDWKMEESLRRGARALYTLDLPGGFTFRFANEHFSTLSSSVFLLYCLTQYILSYSALPVSRA